MLTKLASLRLRICLFHNMYLWPEIKRLEEKEMLRQQKRSNLSKVQCESGRFDVKK